MFPLPFTSNTYGIDILQRQISTDVLFWGHIGPAFIAVAFSFFIYKQTKKLSALYLLFASIAFAIWSYFDLVSWSADGADLMFTWSLLDIFNVLFFIFSYWFLYAFIKKTDLPLWQKVASVSPLIPALYYTWAGIHLNTFYQPSIIALENDYTALGLTFAEIAAIIIIFLFAAVSYARAHESGERLRILLSSVGVIFFLSVFSFTFLATNLLIYFGIGTTGEAYNISVYSLFGMPFFVAFLGYLIAKYQAFDLKLTKSIGLIVALMGLLFVGIFI